jgi:hypothetical protein
MPRRNVREIWLGRASFLSWIRISEFKMAWGRGENEEMRKLAVLCRRAKADRNQQIWGTLFEAISQLERVSVPRVSTKDVQSFVCSAQSAVAAMREYDRPATPWIALLSAQALRRCAGKRGLEGSISLFEEAHSLATEWGKLFIVAVACQELFDSYRSMGNRLSAELYLRRAFAALGKSGVLLADVPLSRRLARGALNVWGDERVAREVLSGSALLLDRKDVKFGLMCKQLASLEGGTCEPSTIFERFVSDWSFHRLPGRPEYVERGKESIDGLMVFKDEGRDSGIAIQAKLYKEPRKAVTKIARPALRTIASEYGGVRIERFWFVIATSDEGGWRDELWHEEYRKKLEELIDHPDIEVRVFLEPDLQTDAVIHDNLYYKYFYGLAQAE